MLYRESGQFKTSYAKDMAVFPIAQDRWFVIAAVIFGFVGVPQFASNYLYTEILIPVLILSLAAIGLNILTGYCGQLSLGTGGFMAVGAYAAYNLALRVPEMNFLVVLVFSGLMATLVGIIFGLPSLRIKGFYLAVATLASQFFLEWTFARVKWFTNYSHSGSVAVKDVELFGTVISNPERKYLFILAVVVVLTLVAKNLVRGRVGRMWMAIRDMDIAAEILGIRPLYAKLSAFAVSSFFIGVAGALWAFHASRLVGAARLRHQPLVPGPVHDHHRRPRLDPRIVPRRRLHRDHAALPQSASRHSWDSHLSGDNYAYRIHGVWRLDRVLPDRRAARFGAAMGDREGETAALALPILRGEPCPWQHWARSGQRPAPRKKQNGRPRSCAPVQGRK